MYRVEIEGVPKLIDNLEKYQEEINGEIERIIRAGAELIKRDVKKRVPNKTGNLEESIKVKNLEVLNSGIKIGIGPVGDHIFYWYFVEFGTVHVKAQPYLRPAFDNNVDKVKLLIQKELNRIIEGGM